MSNNPSNALFSRSFDMLLSLLEVSTCLLDLTSQILIFNGYLKVRESLYTQVIIWVNIILNHIDTRLILPIYEGSCMGHKPK